MNRIDHSLGGYDRLFQSPVLPALSRRASEDSEASVRDFGEGLVAIGFNDSAALISQIAAWRALIDLVRPSVIVTDYSPGAVLAANRHLPVVAVSTARKAG